MKQSDLHTHTTASDGTFSPADNIKRALEKGLGAIAITDHDTVSGIEEAMLEASKHPNFECIPGIEISTLYNGQDIHVLGYFIDYRDEEFLSALTSLTSVRDKRNGMILQKLNKLGINIKISELEAKRHGDGNVGRGHIAEILMEKGIVQSLPEAFDKYLGKGRAAYATPERISPIEAIQIIKKAKGVPVLAHPGIYDADELIPLLCGNGLVGIECCHPDHTTQQVKHYKTLAEKHSLVETAGSDFHGFRNGEVFHGDLGSCSVPLSTIEDLKNFCK
ncbi:metal-dependent phosphoesterase [Fictibacillus phosphorivorans]|uniref:Metal-dependent phosphoesterase n=1 Tax=Fictibacillus phosphorivorans TaxID=1221500 RepID=A0A163R0R8_9BACL|nr:PHP domain-containing protein [Fictibacillus phosphorivorans]KZE66019.1 metal-dependent phosphoesterase [Fictibacillus phosphorivorans]